MKIIDWTEDELMVDIDGTVLSISGDNIEVLCIDGEEVTRENFQDGEFDLWEEVQDGL